MSDEWSDQSTSDPEPQKKGMSSAAKLILFLGIGCGVLLLVCCGAGAWFFSRVDVKEVAKSDVPMLT